jgi:hypothetical protein
MTLSHRLIPALILAASLSVASISRAAEPEAVATAPATAPPIVAAPSVADQIDTYLKTSPATTLPKDAANGVTSGDEPRKAHGFADVTVGSNGYRSAFVQSDLPVGKTGTLSIAVGETRFNGRSGGYGGAYGGAYGGGYGNGYSSRFGSGDHQTLALGLRLGGDGGPGPQDLRCRQAGEDGSDLRDPQFAGGRQRPCSAAEGPTSPQ